MAKKISPLVLVGYAVAGYYLYQWQKKRKLAATVAAQKALLAQTGTTYILDPSLT